jgi:hypothetical protein
MGASDHTRVGWPKGPSEGERAGHSIVGQDRPQMMRRFTGWRKTPDRSPPGDGELTYFSEK